METKICRDCGVPKTLDCFRVDRGYVRGECKECAANDQQTRYAKDPQKHCEATKKWCREHKVQHAATKRAWVKKNPDKHKAYSRKGLYGISDAEFQARVAAQNGVCAICGGPPVGRKHLSVDHCHSTGNVRGLLCGNCNTGLGGFKDSPALVQKALTYLFSTVVK